MEVIIVRSSADIAALCRNNPGCDRAAQAERIAHCDDPFSNLRPFLGKRHKWKVLPGIDLDERQVGIPVGPGHLRRQRLPVVGNDLDLESIVHNVVVRHDVAVGGNEKP